MKDELIAGLCTIVFILMFVGMLVSFHHGRSSGRLEATEKCQSGWSAYNEEAYKHLRHPDTPEAE